MIIKRILTNNAVVIDDENQQEKIVCGKGIAFKKRPGMEIDEMSINQTFILEGGGEYSRFEQLLKDVPLEYLELSSEIINMAKLEFAKKFKDNVIITLSDHLYVAIKRCREGMTISNPLLWDIKNFYEIEYDIGLRALELIKNKFHIQLPNDEAGFIALHIVNVELDEDNMDHIFQVTKVIQEIMTIVKYHFHAEFDTSNVYYYRFITHLKFFALRLLKDNQFNEDEETCGESLGYKFQVLVPFSFTHIYWEQTSLFVSEYTLPLYTKEKNFALTKGGEEAYEKIPLELVINLS